MNACRSRAISGTSCVSQGAAEGTLTTPERIQAARRGFQGQLSAVIEQLASSGDTAAASSTAVGVGPSEDGEAAVATVAAAALLEELLPTKESPGNIGGVQSAARLYEQVHLNPASQSCFVILAYSIQTACVPSWKGSAPFVGGGGGVARVTKALGTEYYPYVGAGYIYS